MSKTQGLYKFFVGTFSSTGLIKFLQFGPEGQQVVNSLPGQNASMASLAFEAVQALQRRGLIDAEFFARLRKEFESEAKKTEVAALAEQWGFGATPHGTPAISSTSHATQPAPLARPGGIVLHISDLHFQTEDEAEQSFHQLFSDLRSELEITKLDGVIVSGDITNTADPKEFAAAVSFFDDLKADFDLRPDQIVLTPGNHDVSWALSKTQHDQRMKPFADFYAQVCGNSYSLEPKEQATIHHFADINLLVLGLNSAWKLDHTVTTDADIQPLALMRALRSIEKNSAYTHCLKVAVWHHPTHSDGEDRIGDAAFLELLAQAGFRLALHGHIHKAQPGLFSHDMSANGRRLNFLGAGTFGAPTKEWVNGIPLQYQLLELFDSRVRVQTRRRENPNGAWKPDARWTQGAKKNPLPYYTIEF